METRRSVPTKVLSLFLSVLMAVSCFGIALPNLAPGAKAAGSTGALQQAFGVALDAGYMNTSDWTGIDTSTAGKVVVIDNTEQGFIYDVVKALADVVAAEATAEGSYNHNTKLADYLIGTLALNQYQANFVKACLPADGDYHDFDGVNGQWNGSEADRATQKKTFSLEVARSVGTAVMTDYASPDLVPDEVETSVALKVDATLKAVEPTLTGAETGGVYVNSAATVTPGTTALSADEKNQITALKNYLAYVNADPFKTHFEKWYAEGAKLDANIYQLTSEELDADYSGFISVYFAAASAEQSWIETFIGQELMNDQYTYANKTDGAKDVVSYRKYVNWIMPETSQPILDRDGEGNLLYNARDNYSRTDRESLRKALATGTALKNIMNNCPAATKALLAEQYGYADKVNYKGESKDPFVAYCEDIQHYIDIYDLQEMQIASDWLLSHNASKTYSFEDENSIFYDETKFVADHYAKTADTEVVGSKTYYVPGDVYTAVAQANEADLASYYTRSADAYTACTASTVFSARETYYTYNTETEKYEKVNAPVAANIATYYTLNDYTYTPAASFDAAVTYYTKAAGYVAVKNPENTAIGSYYEHFADSFAALKGIGNNEFVASAYGVFVLTSDETVKEGKTYYTDATGTTEVASPVDANVANYYEASGELCPITKEDLQLLVNFYNKAVSLLDRADYSDVITEADADKIRETKTLLETELNSRSIATEAYLTVYGWFVKTMAGAAIEGLPVSALTALINTAESKYTALVNAHTGTFKTKDQATGKFYEGENAKCRAYIDKMYVELFNRAKAWIDTTRSDYGSGVNFGNYYAVNGDLLNQDTVLWNWATSNATNINNAANRLGVSVNTGVLTVAPTVSTMQAAVNNFTASNVYGNITQYSKDPFTRYGGAYNDFARTRGYKDYTVYTANGGNLQKTVNKIDTFLGQEHFAQLLGADEKGMNTLTEYIKGILVENVFSDGMMNTILALLFPLLAGLFDGEITDMLIDLNGTDGKSLRDFDDGLRGKLFIFFDGRTQIAGRTGRSTDSFVNITKWMGLNIYPSTFGAYLKTQNGTIPSASALGDWIASAGRDWNRLDLDSDGEFKAADLEKYMTAHNLSWGIDSIKRESYAATAAGFQQYCDARYNKAKQVLGSIFGAANDILKVLFTDATFDKRLDGSSAGQNLVYGYIQDFSYDAWYVPSISGLGVHKAEAQLTITRDNKGIDLYHTVWIPVMEALGINGDVTGSYTFPTLNSSNYSGANLCNALLNPIYELITKVCAKPLESVLKLLPNLAYHLMNNSIQNLLNIDLNIHIQVLGADLTDADGAIGGIAQWDWVTNLLIGAFKNSLKFDVPINLGDKLVLSDMLGFDLTDLNAVLQGVLGMIVDTDENDVPVATLHLPAINTVKLAGAYSSKSTSYPTQRTGGSRTYFSAATSYQQVLYLLLNWVLTAAKTPGFIADVLDFIAKLGGDDPIELPPIVFSILNNIKSTDDVIAAIVELFVPQKYTMSDMEWYNKTGASGQGTLQLSLSDFVYLKYANDWTEEKAQYLYDHVDDVVNSVFNLIDPDMLADYDGDAGKWLNAFINQMFNNEGIWNVVDLLVKLGNTLADNPNIAKLLKQQLKGTDEANYNTDLLVWFNDFATVDDIPALETDKTKLGEDYVKGEYVRYDTTAKQAFVYARTRVKDKDASTDGNPVYKVYNANDPNTYTETKMRAYPNCLANGMPNLTGGGTYTYTPNFTNLTALSTGTENADGEFIRDWQVKLTADTEGFVDGVSAGQTVTLVDGSDNARAVFTAMFCELIGPLAPVFNLILKGTGLELFGALTITGYESYNAALVPLLEALGVKGIPSQTEYDGYTTTEGFNKLVNLLFQAVTDLLTDTRVYDANGKVISGKGPFQNLIDVLPHLFYLLQSNGVSTILKNMLMFAWTLLDTVRPLADINLDDAIHQVLCKLLGYCYDPEARGCDGLVSEVLDLVGIAGVPYSEARANEDREKVDAIFELSLSNLNLESIYTVVEAFTGIDLAPLSYVFEGMCVKDPAKGNGVTKMTSVNGAADNTTQFVTSVFKQPASNVQESYTLNYRGCDVITVTFSVLLDLLRYKDNAAALDELIGLTKEALPGAGALLGDATATGFLDALEIIFEDTPHSGDIQRPNWDYLFEGKNVKDPDNGNLFAWVDLNNDGADNKDNDATQWAQLIKQAGADLSMYHTIYNLEYTTDWTEDVSKNVVALLESVLDYVASLMGSEKGFNDWFNEDILGGYVFNSNAMATIVDLLAKVYDLLPEGIRGTIDSLLDVDMNAWEREGMITKYSSENINDLYDTFKDELTWTVVTYTVAAAYDEDAEYYVLAENGEYVASEVADAEAFAAATYYLRNSEEFSDKQYTIVTSGDYIIVTKMQYGYAADQYNDDKLIEGAVKTYCATDDVIKFKKNGSNYEKIKEDEDGKESVASAYTVNTSYKWFVESDPAYICDRATFLDALKEIVASAGSLIGYLFLEDDYKIFYTAGDNLGHGQTSDDTDAIAINGIGLYGLLVVPVLEALGVDLTGYETDKYDIPAGATAAQKDIIRNQWIDDMFVVFAELFDDIVENPVEWILDTLPGLVYFINAKGLTTCVANTFGVLQDLLDAINMLLDSDSQIGMIISGIDLNNTSLAGLLSIVEQFIPGFHINDDIVAYSKSLYVGQLEAFDSANGYKSFRMKYSTVEEKHDMVTILVSLILEVLTDKGEFVDPANDYQLSEYDNAAAIAALIGEEYEDVVGEIVYALKNPTTVDYKDINWDYFDETLDLANREVPSGANTSIEIPAFAFQYLNYTTDWKYDKAVTTVDGLEDMALAILGLVDEEKFGELESLGELINAEEFFTGETAQKLLEVFENLLFAEDAAIPGELAALIGAVLGADITSWNYTYKFVNEAAKAAEGNENGMDYYTDDDGIKAYVVNDASTFASAVALVLQPAGRLLAWLLFDDSYEFFVGNTDATKDDILLTIPGGNGYEKGLVLLLEALGCKGLGYATKYTSGSADDATGLAGNDLFLYDLAHSLVNRISEILKNPVEEIVGLIPELVYFINANGLGVVVNNLLAGPLALVAQVPSVVALIDEDIDPDAITNVVDDLVEGILKDALKNDEITFSMDSVNIKWIMELVEALTGLEITDLLQNTLDMFYIGAVKAYASKSRSIAYKMEFDQNGFINGGNGDMADFLTILLSFAIDLVCYTDEANGIDNGAALAELVGIDPALIQTIVKFIHDGYTVEYNDYDWFYFDESYALYDVVDGQLVRKTETVGTGADAVTKPTTPTYNMDTAIDVPYNTINYLTYASDWTEDTAKYLTDNRNEIVAAVMNMMGMEGTVADAIKGVFDPATDLYTADTLNKILDLVKPLVEKIPGALLDVLGIVLDVDLSVYNDMEAFDETNFTEGSRTEFVANLTEMLMPLSLVLDWLLFGQNIQYFDKKDLNDGTIEVLIDLKGSEGYKYGLIPLLEALGVTLPTIGEDDTCEDILAVLINNVLARLEAILANPVDEVLNLIPELLYFINANGLATAVHNLLAGVFSLAEEVASTGLLNDLLGLEEGEEVDINGIVNNLLAGLGIELDINKLDLVSILTIVKDLTKVDCVEYELTADTALDETKTYFEKVVTPAEEDGEDKVEYKAVEEPDVADIETYYEAEVKATSAGIDLVDFCTEKKIDDFYFGHMEGYVSANTQVAFKMVFDAEQDMGDLITVIVNLVLEYLMDENNAKAVDALINGINAAGEPNKSTVGAIVKILLGLRELDDVEPEEIDWDYFTGTEPLSATGINVPTAQFVYLDYSNMWTEELAGSLGAGLTDMVNQILALTAGEGEEPKTIDGMLSELVDIDSLLNADLLNKILDTVAPLLYGEDSILATELLNVIGLVLGADLTQWDGSYRFEAYDETQTYTTDAATGLKTREGADGTIYAIENASDFASGLTLELTPVQKLLGWLLLGNDYRFFVSKDDGNVNASGDRQDNELLIIPGFNGYDLSLTLLLEALGCEGLKKGSEYAGNEAQMLKDIINALINRVEEILANPIDEILDLIPELLYFINAGGLNAVIMNLAGGLLEVVEYVNDSGLLEEPIAISGYTLDRNVIDVLVSGLINDALVDTLDKNGDGELTDDEKLTFALKNVNIGWIINLAGQITGLDIQGALGDTYDLSKFAIGDIVRYDSASTAYDDEDGVSQTYKAVSSAKVRGDIITILLSLVLDVIEYKSADADNAAALANLLKGVADGKITVTVINSAIEILQGWEDNVEYLTPDWFYCVTSPATYTEDITSTTDVTLKNHFIGYLEYSTDWTEETAEYLVNNVDKILAEVMKLVDKDSTVTSVAGLIGEKFVLQSDLYTADNLNKIVELVSGLADKLGEELVDILGMILTVDLSAYNDMSFSNEEIKDRDSFVAGLVEVLKPIYTLLDWLLFGKDLAFLFDNDAYNSGDDARDLIHITGGEGYDYAIVPLFEALGIEMVAADSMNDADLTTVLNNVLAKVEAIMDAPVDEVLALLPNLIYFINANGLSVVVNNLLASIVALVDVAAPIIVEFVGDEIVLDEDKGLKIVLTDDTDEILSTKDILNNLINGLLAQNGIDVEIDYTAVDLLTAVSIAEAVTGLKIADVVTAAKIDEFYIGEISYFQSANGKPAFRMSYSTEEEAHDLLTVVLNFVVEVLLYDGNKEALYELVKLDEDTTKTVDAIIELLTNPMDYDYKELNWNYFDETAVLGATIAVPKSEFIYLAYANDWTYTKAATLDAGLADMVDSIIAMIAKDGDPTTLGDLLADKVDIDALIAKPELLNSILELVQKYLFGEDAVIGETLLDLVGLVFNADLREWDGNYTFVAYDEAASYTTDTATGLKYTVVDGKINYAVANADDLVAGLCKILEPATELLGFLFMGGSYGFFTDDATGTKTLLKVTGSKGYQKGLALLLEALGVKGLKADYADANVMLKEVLTALVARVKEILANPIDEVFGLLTELIYFINAGGLDVVFSNLVAVAFNVLHALEEAGMGKLLDVDELVDGLLKGALGENTPDFTLEGVNIAWAIKVADVVLADKLGMPTFEHDGETIGAIEETLYKSLKSDTLYPLETLAIGKAVKYDSVTDLTNTYKMVFGDGTEEGGASRGDFITIILSFVLDLIRTEGVGAAIENVAGLKAGTINDVLKVITEYAIEIDPEIDWFYFDPDYTYEEDDDLTTFVPSIQYLSYASDWNEDLADYLDDNLEDIVAAVFELIGKEGTVADLIKGVFDPAEKLYNAELLNTITLAIANLTKGLEDVILDVAGLLLDVNLGWYKSVCTYDDAEGKFTECTYFKDEDVIGRETFALALCEVLEPIYEVLDWLFFGENYAFFNRSTATDNIEDLLVLNGYDGYAYGLVPVLEALGVTLKPVAEYKALGEYDAQGVLYDTVSAVFARMEQILADPVETVLALIPNLLYFINANGLTSAVNHLLGSVLGLLDNAVPAVIDFVGSEIKVNDDFSVVLADEDGNMLETKDILNNVLNGLLGDKLGGVELDIKDIRLIDILNVAEALTGLELTDFIVENGIENFYVGQITYFESANGEPAFKMAYSEDKAKDRSDLITIVVNYLLEAVAYKDEATGADNAKAIDTLIKKEGMVDSILDMLETLGKEAVPGDYHWAYFNEEADDEAPVSTDMTLPVTPFVNHLAYANDWTQDKANVIFNNADDVATAILTLIAGDDETKAHNVADIISGAFDLYTAENANKLVDLTKKLYDLADEKLVNLIGMVLGCDLSDWNGLNYTDAEVYDADTFSAAVYEVLDPLSRVLDWLLFGGSYEFFVEDKNVDNKIITIGGANGYIYGLAQLLIALGVELPEYEDGYKCETVLADGRTFLKAVLDAVLDRVDEILADPVDEALELLPELLYFINANGVSTAAYNLAGGLLNAVNVLFEQGIITLEADGVACASIEDYLAASLGLDIRNLDLEGIFKFLDSKDMLKGIKLYDVFMGNYTVSGDEVSFTYDAAGDDNILEKFYVGDVEPYTYGGLYGYKMVPAEGAEGDVLTMLLSIVFDVLFYEGNEEAIAALINDLLGDGVTFTTENFVALKALLMNGAAGTDGFGYAFTANWAYYLGLSDAELQAQIDAILAADTTALPELPERTQHYLEYDNNWNTETVEYLDANLNDIVDLVINMIDEDCIDLEAFIESKLDLYTADTVNAIVDLLAGLVGKLDETLTEELRDTLLITAGTILGAEDITKLITPVTEAEVYDKETFVNALADKLGELEGILDWLLFGQDIELFAKLEDGSTLIKLSGGEGYKYGLAPLFAALGCETDIAHASGKEALRDVLMNLADRIDEILYGANGKKTLDEVLALLPELIYFINAGAVSECVMNLLTPVDALLAIVNENLGNGSVLKANSVNDLIADIDLANIDFDFLFDLLKDSTGIDIANSTGTPSSADKTLGTVGDYIKNFYFGELETVTTYGGVQSVRMNYTAEDTRMDMLTILVTLALDVATSANNKAALVDLLGSEETYNVILALLTGGEVEIEYQKFSWILTEYANTGKIVSPMTANGEMVRDFLYGPLYTRAMGEYMTKYLQLLIDTYITLLGVEINGKMVFSLEDILDNLVGENLYKNEYIRSIYDALVDLLNGLRTDTLGEELYDHIANVLKSALGVDLNYWFTEYTPKTIAEGDQGQFIDEICRMLRPAYPILKWLLTADKIALFNKANEDGDVTALDDNDYIYIQGAEGYKYAIVPILEALNNGDTSNIMAPDAYIAAVEADATGDALLKNILKPILDKVDGILEDPINGVLNLLPAVVYFVNSNGLDTCIKNLLGSVFMLLNKIDPLISDVEAIHDEDGTLNLYKLIGIDLKNINLNELLDSLLAGVEEDTGLAISDLGADLVKELTLGVVESYTSQINSGDFFQDMYTMKYAAEGSEGDQVDFVTLILRFVLKFISTGNNAKAIEALLKDSVSGDGYTFLCSLLDNFAQMAGTEDGMDKIMYTVYYIFYGALVAGVATNNGLAEFNGNYSFLNQLFATSDVAFLRQIEKSMGDWLNKWAGNDIVDEDEVIPNGQISFWQKIVEFFKKIINFFKNLFK